MQHNLQSKYSLLPSIAGVSVQIKGSKLAFLPLMFFSQNYEAGLTPHYQDSLEGLRTELFDVAVYR